MNKKQQIQMCKQTDGSFRLQLCVGDQIVCDLTLGAADAVFFAGKVTAVVKDAKLAELLQLSHESQIGGAK